jgi:hypothetical protein
VALPAYSYELTPHRGTRQSAPDQPGKQEQEVAVWPAEPSADLGPQLSSGGGDAMGDGTGMVAIRREVEQATVPTVEEGLMEFPEKEE